MQASKQPLDKVIEIAVVTQTRAFKRGITTLYIGRLGEEFDRFLNVAILRGQIGETISLHAATDALEGDRWACALCRWLHWTVERNHCAKTIAVIETPTAAGLRAGAQLVAIAVALVCAIVWIGCSV